MKSHPVTVNVQIHRLNLSSLLCRGHAYGHNLSGALNPSCKPHYEAFFFYKVIICLTPFYLAVVRFRALIIALQAVSYDVSRAPVLLSSYSEKV